MAPDAGDSLRSPRETDCLSRYARQVLYEGVGTEGQQRLLAAHVLLVGCGALGTVLADTLVRAGVGFLRLCDRDYIERDNLQRQVLFDESDIAAQLPKAQAAANRLARINPEVQVQPWIVDVTADNIERLADGCSLLLDGTDNFETRYLINDLAVRDGKPWVYGAVIGASGLVMPILPGDTPCLRCVFEEAPPPELNPTCDTAGVIGPAVHIVASFQAVEAMKILMGRLSEVNRHLLSIDAWTGRVSNLNVRGAFEQGNCLCCKQRKFEYLEGTRGSTTTAMCGRNAVQVYPGKPTVVDFAAIAAKLAPGVRGEITYNPFLLKARVEDFELTLFTDGRAILKGTADLDRARSLYARYVGL